MRELPINALVSELARRAPDVDYEGLTYEAELMHEAARRLMMHEHERFVARGSTVSARKPYEAPAVTGSGFGFELRTARQKLAIIAALLVEDVDGTGCDWYNKRSTLKAVNAVLCQPTLPESEASDA